MKKKERRRMSFEKKQRLAGYLFISPLILGVCILFLPNIVKTVIFSMNDIVIGKSTYTLDFQGFKYYYDALFVDSDFIQNVIRGTGQMIVQVR